MKVAVVAVGNFARYFIDELRRKGHQVLAISRSRKSFLEGLDVAQHVTNYAEGDLAAVLDDCDAAVSTLSPLAPEYVSIHHAILQACQKSATCKRFIPATFAGNLEEFPDEPLEFSHGMALVLEKLRNQQDVSWSVFSVGWLADYILADDQRYLSNPGSIWPQDREKKIFTLYGDGSQLVNFTSARDTARATAVLLEYDRHKWEHFTYISGTQLKWHELGQMIQKFDPAYTIQRKSLAQSVRQYQAKETAESRVAAILELWSHGPSVRFPWTRVEQHRTKFFPNLAFKNIEELVDEAALSPGKIV